MWNNIYKVTTNFIRLHFHCCNFQPFNAKCRKGIQGPKPIPFLRHISRSTCGVDIKDMVDLQGPIFLKFSFYSKLSIIILTIISTKKFGKILKHTLVIF